MLGSFVPCIGSLAFIIGIPAAIVSFVALGIAYSQNAKKTFAVVAVTISMIGVLISGIQYFSIVSAGKQAQKEMERWSRESAPPQKDIRQSEPDDGSNYSVTVIDPAKNKRH
jgi:uncharacterized membrane protein